MKAFSAAVSAWAGARLLASSALGQRQGLDERFHNLRKVHSNPTSRLGGIAVAVRGVLVNFGETDSQLITEQAFL